MTPTNPQGLGYLTPEEVEALESVDKYGELHFPVGKDRAALCHASGVLAAAVRRLSGRLEEAEKALEMCRDNDKTEYDYTGKDRFNRSGAKAPAGERWQTPREIATAALSRLRDKP